MNALETGNGEGLLEEGLSGAGGGLRILAWNCAMALHKKTEAFATLRPDIAVISECGKGSLAALESLGYAGVWTGSNPHKGLGIFVRAPLRPRMVKAARQKWVAAVDVVGEGETEPALRVIGVWACRVGNRNCENYVGQIYRALTRNPVWLESGNTIVAGDFNSNSIWDANRAVGNHTDVVNLLAKRNIVSAYHTFYGEAHGKETRPTLYLLKNRNRPFHLDYVFVSSAWKVEKCAVRNGKKWHAWSDHRPLVVDVTLSGNGNS